MRTRACVLQWQPRYRGPEGRQTGGFASPPFDGFALIHYDSNVLLQHCFPQAVMSLYGDALHEVPAGTYVIHRQVAQVRE